MSGPTQEMAKEALQNTSKYKKEMEQIRKGIRVQDVEEFDSVLSTFSEFAVGASEEVIKQTESK